ncbi:MAG: hypothetical protein PHH83_04535, partial [Patescibacteria group bacterium]|nr:hypothetical protein [Patescibacteria group bacterium]
MSFENPSKKKKEEVSVDLNTQESTDEILQKTETLKQEIKEIVNGRDLHSLSIEELTIIKSKIREIAVINKVIESSSIEEQINHAKEIMGNSEVMGIEEIEKAFDIKVKQEDIPDIPFSDI